MSNSSLDVDKKLFSKSLHEFSDKEYTALFEQYKLYVDLADKISGRRQHTNSFFLGVNVALTTVLSSTISLLQDPIKYIWVVFSASSGILVCIAWRRLIHSYSQLNGGKFKVIFLLESYLPAKLFDAEWDALRHGDGTVYTPFTKMEKKIPIVFIGLYITISLFIVLSSFLTHFL